MKTSDLIFVGIKGSVVALHRSTGAQVWATHLKGFGFVNVLWQNESLLVACAGEIFCLDPLTGNGRWHNPLKGFGTGLATMATTDNPGSGAPSVLAEQRRCDEEAGASAAAVSGVAASS